MKLWRRLREKPSRYGVDFTIRRNVLIDCISP